MALILWTKLKNYWIVARWTTVEACFFINQERKLEDNQKFIKDSFELFKKSAKLGFGVTFLSTHSDIKHKKNYYSDPEFILNHSYTLSKRILLDNMFMPFEFSVFVDFREDLKNLSYRYF